MKANRLSKIAIAVATGLLCSTVNAQETEQEPQAVEVIQAKGIRGSLTSAMDIKVMLQASLTPYLLKTSENSPIQT
ncbi:hypothetical protein P4S73_28485 [Paraglaciecola sp. Hal342]